MRPTPRTRRIASPTLRSPKRSVSLVIDGPDGLLLVRRPEGDESLPGLWGLPAASLRGGESEEDAVRRAGSEKLGVEVVPVRPIGREGTMTDWEARIVRGSPSVPQEGPNTQYVELRWGDARELAPAARQGSLCSRALLCARGLDWDG
jgi:8-oxo-dGTP diphosphatase